MDKVADIISYVAMFVCALTMGFAIQRGNTCTVAAVAETLTERKLSRLIAIIEAAIWVLGGLLLGGALGFSQVMPPGYQLTVWTVIGAVMLGVGAAVNRACVFGAIARFGNGDWTYLATPVGFYLGCLIFTSLGLRNVPHPINTASLLFSAPIGLGLLIGAWMLYRCARIIIKPRTDRHHQSGSSLRIWAPHEATLVIGATFLLLLWLGGPWTYTDLLAELARGDMAGVINRSGLLLALLGGAVWGGLTAGFFKLTPMRIGGVLRCMAGGVLMGIGSSAIPGGNDGLILTGLPLLWPHAWVAFITMWVSIALYLSLSSTKK